MSASRLLLLCGALTLQVALGEEAAAPAAAPAAPPVLTAEQESLSRRMLGFMDVSERDIFARLAKLNGDGTTEIRDFPMDNADHHVRLARGKVVEKAGWYVTMAKKANPPFVPEPIFNRYMEINVHPRTPHVGMLHATVYFAYFANGKNLMAGYLDYVPAVWHDEDNQRLKASLDAVYARHGVDISRFRKQLCESAFGAKNHRDRLKAACVGTSLYDPPFLEATPANFDLASEAFTAFVNTYFDILEKRRSDRASSEDLLAQQAMRKRWLEDQLFADTFSMKVVPYEVWSLANQAPEVRF